MATRKDNAAEREIRRLDGVWGDLASKQDLEAVVALYASDASLVWPDEPAHHGTAAIREAFTGMFKEFKGLTLKFTPERIDISDSGDLASDFGVVSLGFDGEQGRVEMTAKYLVVWKQVNGAWKVLYDSWNSNSKS